MGNKWKEIWASRRENPAALAGGWQEVFLELKRLNGYDIVADSISLSAFLKMHRTLKEHLHLTCGKSLYDVGCGAGANLYLMQRDGIVVGGTDYAAHLVDIARRVVPDMQELTCGEADAFDTTLKYDAVLSNSVFSYFADEDFATRVLLRMLDKTTGAIGLIDLHDADKKDQFLAYRRATIPDYDKRYKGLGKLFYHRRFFEDFARTHNLDLTFPPLKLDGYWNTPFIFHVFLYRK